MATTQQIQIVAVDKTARVLGNVNNRLKGIGKTTKSIESGFGNLQTKILAVGSALGAAFGIKKILAVSSEVEQLGLRFQFLFGSVEEGNKAFDTLLDYASRVPFTLQQIQHAFTATVGYTRFSTVVTLCEVQWSGSFPRP